MPLDLAFYLAVCLQGQTIFCAEPLYSYRLHAGQMSSTNMALNNSEVIRVIADACLEGERRGFLRRGVRDKALRIHLTGAILNDALYGDRRQTFSRLTSWVAVTPFNTLRSRGFLVAISRIIFGARGFRMLYSFARKLGLRVRV